MWWTPDRGRLSCLESRPGVQPQLASLAPEDEGEWEESVHYRLLEPLELEPWVHDPRGVSTGRAARREVRAGGARGARKAAGRIYLRNQWVYRCEWGWPGVAGPGVGRRGETDRQIIHQCGLKLEKGEDGLGGHV